MPILTTLRLAARRLLTEPIYQYEQKKHYPARGLIFDFPPIAINPRPNGGMLLVVSHAVFFADACWAAYSQLLHLPQGMHLRFVVDGVVDAETVAKGKALFPGVEVTDGTDLLNRLEPQYPHIAAFRSKHPLGLKLAAVLASQQEDDVLYTDSDVLCLNQMPELTKAFQGESSNLYLLDANGGLEEAAVLERAQTHGISPVPFLNSGFLFLHRNSLSLPLAEDILDCFDRNPASDPKSWFVEQTLISVLMAQANAKPLPADRYVVSMARQLFYQKDISYKDVAVRHFVGPVRHRLYGKAMPLLHQKLQRQWRSQSASSES